MRPDKVTLAALAATLGLYRSGLAITEIPVWRMIATPTSELRARAGRLARAAGPNVRPIDLEATVGGGSLPGEVLPSAGVSLDVGRAEAVLTRLRRDEPCVVGRIEDGRVVLDLRTVDPSDDPALGSAIAGAIR
jgi:L-seryl-tRNA(Ser) seleniumtransferase